MNLNRKLQGVLEFRKGSRSFVPTVTTVSPGGLDVNSAHPKRLRAPYCLSVTGIPTARPTFLYRNGKMYRTRDTVLESGDQTRWESRVDVGSRTSGFCPSDKRCCTSTV